MGVSFPNGLKKALRDACSLAKEAIAQEKGILVVTHNDADGLSSGGILHKAFLREGYQVHTRSVKQLDRDVLKEISKSKAELVIFSDLGAGVLDDISELFNCDIIILDHHQPVECEHELIHVNPHNVGIDGSREISSSGVAYLFAKEMNKKNQDLAGIAIVGAIGDMQDSTGELIGLNKIIQKDGEEAKVLRVEKDLRLYGRQTRPLFKAIEYTTEPFIPGLSGSESASLQFLSDLDIPIKKNDEFTKLADLSEEEKKRLTTALILRMIEHRIPPKIAESIVGDVFTLIKEDKRTPLRDAKEYATLLNGCGKYEKNGLGIAVVLGDRDQAYKEALEMLKDHKSYICSCYRWVSENMSKIKDEEVVYSFHAKDEINDSVLGAVISMVLNSRTLEEIKPIIAFAYDKNGKVKVSARATRELVERGVNLGKAMHFASEKVGGEGGGHNIAAGASIAIGDEEKFLRYAKEEIRRQLNAE